MTALLGGVVGAGLFWLLSGLLGSEDDIAADVETLRARLASLETAEPVAVPDLGPLETRFVALEERVTTLPVAAPDDGAAEALAADVATLRAQVQDQAAALQAQAQQVEALASAPAVVADTGSDEAVAQLASRIAAVDARVAQLDAAPAAVPGPDAGLVERIDALETAIAGLPGQNAVAAATADLVSSEELASIRLRLDELATSVDAARNDDIAARLDTLASDAEQARADIASRLDAVSARAEDVSSSIADLSSRVADLSPRLDGLADDTATLAATDESLRSSMETLRERLAEIEGAVSGTSTRLDDVAARLDLPGERERAVAAVALAGLQGAVDRGTPYGTYLDTLETTGVVSTETLQALRGRADEAIPTRAALVTRWGRLASEARRAAVRSEARSGVAGIFASARSLVDVAPVDPGEGDDVSALVGRIQARLDAGSLDQALLLWQQLPQVSRLATLDWGRDVEARLAVETAVGAVSGEVLSADPASGDGANG